MTPTFWYVCGTCHHNYIWDTVEQVAKYAPSPCTNCGGEKRPGVVRA